LASQLSRDSCTDVPMPTRSKDLPHGRHQTDVPTAEPAPMNNYGGTGLRSVLTPQRTVFGTPSTEPTLCEALAGQLEVAYPRRRILKLMNEDLNVLLDQRRRVLDVTARGSRDPQAPVTADRPLSPVVALEEEEESIRDRGRGHAATASIREISRSTSRPSSDWSTATGRRRLCMTYGRTTRAIGATGGAGGTGVNGSRVHGVAARRVVGPRACRYGIRFRMVPPEEVGKTPARSQTEPESSYMRKRCSA